MFQKKTETKGIENEPQLIEIVNYNRYTMEQKTQQILGCLQYNARTPLVTIGERISMRTKEVLEAVEKLEKSHIKGYTAIVYPEKQQLSSAIVLAKLGAENCIDTLLEKKSIVNLSTIAGNHDIQFEVVDENNENIHDLIHTLSSQGIVKNAVIHPVLKTLRRERM